MTLRQEIQRPNTIDRVTRTSASPKPFYSDIKWSRSFHPITGNVLPVKDVESVQNAVRNIVATRRGELPHRPNFGTDIDRYIFEVNDVTTRRLMEQVVRASVQTQEPRVRILSVTTDFDDVSVDITIEFEIISLDIVTTVVVTAERVR